MKITIQNKELKQGLLLYTVIWGDWTRVTITVTGDITHTYDTKGCL